MALLSHQYAQPQNLSDLKSIYIENAKHYRSEENVEINKICCVGRLPHRSFKGSTVINTERAVQIILNALYNKPKQAKHKHNKLVERNKQIVELYQSGHTLEGIASMFGISSQRIHQIINDKRK